MQKADKRKKTLRVKSSVPLHLFAPLNETESAALIRLGTLLTLTPGQTLPSFNGSTGGLYMICSGLLLVSTPYPRKNSQGTFLMDAGRVLGLEETTYTANSNRNVQALLSTELLYFDKSIVEKHFLGKGKYVKSLLKWFCDELEKKEEDILSFLNNDVPGRVARLITHPAFNGKNEISLKYLPSHVIAQLCGTSTAYITQVLKKLGENNILAIKNETVYILNSVALKNYIRH